MSKIIGSIPTKEFIEWTLISPKWNGEKLSEASSRLIQLTWKICFNCLSAEWTWSTWDYYSVRNCENSNSPLNGGGNSASNSCDLHE